MGDFKNESQEIDWEGIILKLTSFTQYLVSTKTWFSGRRSDSFIAGKQVSDYVFEAIQRYLEHPEKFDQQKGTLLNYLKYSLIRSLVSNDLVSTENKISNNLAVNYNEDENIVSYSESLLPSTNAYFDDEIDYNQILSTISKEILNDKIVENIFYGMCDNLKRKDIIEVFQISEIDFDNGIRRLKTILKRVAKNFQLKPN